MPRQKGTSPTKMSRRQSRKGSVPALVADEPAAAPALPALRARVDQHASHILPTYDATVNVVRGVVPYGVRGTAAGVLLDATEHECRQKIVPAVVVVLPSRCHRCLGLQEAGAEVTHFGRKSTLPEVQHIPSVGMF